ncbi:hypothetical protein GCM10009801_45120 [Streptomyces albiaxialis]|uniref:Uncharacterized protein n=1 Tax=Streptomyces albiaxialis TaxID=329523 RepID=A0ABN2W7Y4_9ACTN
MRFRTATAAAALAAAAVLGSAGSAFAWGNNGNDGPGHDGNSKSRIATIKDYIDNYEDAMITRISERSDNDSSVSSEFESESTNVVGNVSNDHSGARTGGMYFG